MKTFPFLVILGLATLPCALAEQPAVPTSSVPLTKILESRALWGKDFPAVVAHLPRWNRAGVRTVALFANRVVGDVAYRTKEEAQRAASQFPPLSEGAQRKPKPAFERLMAQARKQASRFRVEAVPFLDDDSFRVAWTGPSLQVLAKGLTIMQVQSILGPAESSITQLIQNATEREPVVLTLHSYAGGSAVFIESNYAPRPGLVDRVVLDVSVVLATVF